MKRLLLPLLLLFAASICAQEYRAYTVETVPNPKSETTNFWVSDPDDIIDDEVENLINYTADTLKSYSNAELCVVAVNAFDENHYYSAFDFALELFNTWGIGSAENNAGVLIFLSLGGSGQEGGRDIRIVTGRGLEGLLPDVKCDEIIDDCIDILAAGHYSEALLRMSLLIYNELTTTEAQAELMLGYKPKPTEGDKAASNYFIFAI